ncbi:MAG: GspH/FimT family pseudopilin [Pseudomonadota bacterium]
MFQIRTVTSGLCPKKWPSGFTLMEMIVVMAIVAVMILIAVPSFLSISSRGQLKSAARDIISNMQYTRIQAIKKSATWAVQFDVADSRYRLLSDDGADDTWNTGDDTVYKTVNLSDYPGVSYGSGHGVYPGGSSVDNGVTFSADRVTFKSNGTSESGTVYIKNREGDTFAITSLSATGRIKTYYHYGTAWEE